MDRHIRSVHISHWPLQLREQGDSAIEAACQYGLGLIRTLAEYEVSEGIRDTDCAGLAAALAKACSELRKAVAAEVPGSAPPDPVPSRKSPHAWRISAAMRDRAQACEPAEQVKPRR